MAIQHLDQSLYQSTPLTTLGTYHTKVNYLQHQLISNHSQQIRAKEYQLQKAISQLDLLSPLKRMSKGFAYVTSNKMPVDSITKVDIGDSIAIQLADGRITAQITGTDKKQLSKIKGES